MHKIFRTLMMRLTHQNQVACSLDLRMKNWLLFQVCKKTHFVNSLVAELQRKIKYVEQHIT